MECACCIVQSCAVYNDNNNNDNNNNNNILPMLLNSQQKLKIEYSAKWYYRTVCSIKLLSLSWTRIWKVTCVVDGTYVRHGSVIASCTVKSSRSTVQEWLALRPPSVLLQTLDHPLTVPCLRHPRSDLKSSPLTEKYHWKRLSQISQTWGADFVKYPRTHWAGCLVLLVLAMVYSDCWCHWFRQRFCGGFSSLALKAIKTRVWRVWNSRASLPIWKLLLQRM